MMRRILLATALAASALVLAGCDDDDHTYAPRDVTPPAAPRGFYSVTGDGQVYLHWLENTESDLAGYRVYMSPCASGPDCPYDRVGTTTGNSFNVTGLLNGETRFFALAAVDQAGNESDLTYEDVFDTPRPEGWDLSISNYLTAPNTSGFDFSAQVRRPWDHAETDIFYGYQVDGQNVYQQIFVPDFETDIQDAGFTASLDDVDFAPSTGWSPSGTVEAIQGHAYVVWTRTNHYAKFRVTSVGPSGITVDWAYQVDPGNRELKARPVREEGQGRRPIVWLP